MDPMHYVDIESTIADFGPIRHKSKVYATCPECGRQRVTTFRCIKNAVREHGDCLCASCRQKPIAQATSRKRWQDPEYRERQKSGCIEYWSNQEARTEQSNRSRQMWTSPKYRVKQAASLSARLRDPEHAARFAEAMRRLWSNPDFKAKMSGVTRNRALLSSALSARWKSDWGAQMRRRLASPANRSAKSAVAKKLWLDIQYRSRQSAGFHAVLAQLLEDPGYHRMLSEAGKKPWQSEEYRAKFAQMRAEFLQGSRRSSLERIAATILSSMNVKFLEQVAVGPYVYDMFVPEYNTFVEVQGEYWHSGPDAVRRDAAKLSYLEKACPDSRMLYLHEREFLNPSAVRQKISGVLWGDQKTATLSDFDFDQVYIRVAGAAEVRDFLASFHYAQFGRSPKYLLGAYLDGELIAVVKFSPPVRKEVATSMGLAHTDVLEVDRVCIHPERHKRNFASWLLTRSCHMAFNQFTRVKTLVSFADSTYGHLGTIYVASGWTRVTSVAPDYYYVGPDGWMMHKKTLYGHARRMKMKENEYAAQHGYMRVMGKEKTKFRLDRRVECKSSSW